MAVTRKQFGVNEYHVYDNRITDIAGIAVTERGERRTVHLTPKQAQYLIDQGAIGVEPASERSREAHALMRQFRRERVRG